MCSKVDVTHQPRLFLVLFFLTTACGSGYLDALGVTIPYTGFPPRVATIPTEAYHRRHTLLAAIELIRPAKLLCSFKPNGRLHLGLRPCVRN